jgi:hypothetical protein
MLNAGADACGVVVGAAALKLNPAPEPSGFTAALNENPPGAASLLGAGAVAVLEAAENMPGVEAGSAGLLEKEKLGLAAARPPLVLLLAPNAKPPVEGLLSDAAENANPEVADAVGAAAPNVKPDPVEPCEGFDATPRPLELAARPPAADTGAPNANSPPALAAGLESDEPKLNPPFVTSLVKPAKFNNN